MTSTKKYKSGSSRSRSVPSRGRYLTHFATDQSPTPKPTTSPFLPRVARPKRWRKSSKIAQKHQPSIYDSPPDGEQSAHHGSSQHREGSVKLRFSFTSTANDDDDDEDEPPVEDLNSQRSIQQKLSKYHHLPSTAPHRYREEDNDKTPHAQRRYSSASHPRLPMRDSGRPAGSPAPLPFSAPPTAEKQPTANKQREGYGFSYSDKSFQDSFYTQTASEDEAPTTTKNLVMPILTKPTKKREGYGFSFTDTLFYDSDEYPDTICGANGSEIETNSLPAASSSSHPSPIVSSPLIKQNSSFAEVVVMRDIGSFNMTKPQKHLACTTASREDTLRLKVAAKALDKYAESSEVYGRLISRLENMVLGTLEVAAGNHGNSARGIMTWAAMKLQNFLTENQGGRIETGESRRLVEHEIEWVGWLVEASYTGVMHLKTEGCGCKPDWEGE